MRRLPRLLAATSYALLGAVALLRPEVVPAVFGGTAGTPEARNEIRAVYGGLSVAIAVTALTAGSREPEAAGRLRALSAASLGMAVARAVGALVERRLRPWPTGAFLALEVGLAVALHPGPPEVGPSDARPGPASAGGSASAR
jgi:hypothetical protein